MIKSLLGYGAGLLALVFYLRIIIGIIRKKIRPSRITWLIWGINDFLLLLSSFFLGARNTLWVPLVYAVCGLICLVLSARHDRTPLQSIDRACLAGSLLAWLLWGVTHNALLALFLGLAVNTLGAVPTWVKTFRDPHSERSATWAVIFASGVFQFLAAERYTADLILFPFDTLIISGGVLVLTLRSRGKASVRSDNATKW